MSVPVGLQAGGKVPAASEGWGFSVGLLQPAWARVRVLPLCPGVFQSHPCFSLQNCSCSWGEAGKHRAAGAAEAQQCQNLPGARALRQQQRWWWCRETQILIQGIATLPSPAC